MSTAVASVVISHNSAPELGRCLTSLCAADAVSSIVVVDNCSEDSSPSVVASFSDPRIRLLRLKHNTGFAGGCNHGFAVIDPAIPVHGSLVPEITVVDKSLPFSADISIINILMILFTVWVLYLIGLPSPRDFEMPDDH